MRRSGYIATLAFAALAASCALTGPQLVSLTEKNGQFYADGIAVPHHREMRIHGVLAAAPAEMMILLETHTGLIDVVGVPGEAYELVLDLHTEFEGDGDVSLENGRLVVQGNDGRVLINGIRGRIPDAVKLAAKSSTGSIVLASFVGPRVKVDSGVGPVRLASCRVESIHIDSGTGDVALESTIATEFVMASGQGALSAEDCDLRRFSAESAMGDFELRSCRIERAMFSSGTGDVVLEDTVVSDMRSALGTGQLIWRTAKAAQDG